MGKFGFYGIVNKTEELGDKQIGIEYLKNLAKLINGKFDDNYKEWNWCVKKNGQYIKDYLPIKKEWKDLISETIEKINILEENK